MKRESARLDEEKSFSLPNIPKPKALLALAGCALALAGCGGSSKEHGKNPSHFPTAKSIAKMLNHGSRTTYVFELSNDQCDRFPKASPGPAIDLGSDEQYGVISLKGNVAHVNLYTRRYANDSSAYVKNCTTDDGVQNNDMLLRDRFATEVQVRGDHLVYTPGHPVANNTSFSSPPPVTNNNSFSLP